MSRHSLPPDRELDAVVAEKVMGIEVQRDQYCGSFRALIGDKRDNDPWEIYVGTSNDRVPRYSTDLTAAWELVTKVSPNWRGFAFMIDYCEATKDWRAGWVEWSWGEVEGRCTGQSESVPHAICLAALEVRKAEA